MNELTGSVTRGAQADDTACAIIFWLVSADSSQRFIENVDSEPSPHHKYIGFSLKLYHTDSKPDVDNMQHPGTSDNMTNLNFVQACCSTKSLIKIGLLFCTTLLVMTLIFTAFSHEPMNRNQTSWWWAFLISLLITSAMTTTALFVLIYTDYSAVKDENPDAEASRKMPGVNDSSSFKTVLTINSMPDQSIKIVADKVPATNSPTLGSSASAPVPATGPGSVPVPEQEQSNFVNFTPEPKSPVTVVDIPAMIAKKRDQRKNKAILQKNLEESANLGAIPSSALAEAKPKNVQKKIKKKAPKKKKALDE